MPPDDRMKRECPWKSLPLREHARRHCDEARTVELPQGNVHYDRDAAYRFWARVAASETR